MTFWHTPTEQIFCMKSNYQINWYLQYTFHVIDIVVLIYHKSRIDWMWLNLHNTFVKYLLMHQYDYGRSKSTNRAIKQCSILKWNYWFHNNTMEKLDIGDKTLEINKHWFNFYMNLFQTWFFSPPFPRFLSV